MSGCILRGIGAWRFILLTAWVVSGCVPPRDSVPVEAAAGRAPESPPSARNDAAATQAETPGRGASGAAGTADIGQGEVAPPASSHGSVSTPRSAPPSDAGASAFATAPSVARVVAGDHHSCALLEDGAVLCWGWNFSGGLGLGHSKEVDGPMLVQGLPAVRDLVVDDSSSCAIDTVGTALCWGRVAEVEGAPREQSYTPKRVDSLPSVATIAISDRSACALDQTGTIWCWGRNMDGQLGLGPALVGVEHVPPTRVPGIAKAKGVAMTRRAGYAWLEDGTVLRWGHVEKGPPRTGTQLRPTAPPAPSPTVVQGAGPASFVRTSSQQACAVRTDAAVRCWVADSIPALAAGRQWDMGPQLAALAKAFGARGPFRQVLFPDAHELGGATDLVVANHDGCGLTSDGKVWCWGSTERSTTGKPAKPKQLHAPAEVQGITDARAIAGGFQHRCALRSDGSVQCWGRGTGGRMGRGSYDEQVRPQPVEGLPRIRQIAAGDYCTFAIAEDGSLWSWGQNWTGACGFPHSEDAIMTPRKVPIAGR